MLSFANHFAHLATYSQSASHHAPAESANAKKTRKEDAARAAAVELLKDNIVAFIATKGKATRVQIMGGVGISKGATTHRLISLVNEGRIKKGDPAAGSCANLFEVIPKKGRE